MFEYLKVQKLKQGKSEFKKTLEGNPRQNWQIQRKKEKKRIPLSTDSIKNN